MELDHLLRGQCAQDDNAIAFSFLVEGLAEVSNLVFACDVLRWKAVVRRINHHRCSELLRQ